MLDGRGMRGTMGSDSETHDGAREAAEASVPASDRSPLYARVGGAEGIALFVEQFYQAVRSDALLAPLFARLDIESLKAQQREFMALVLGGKSPLECWNILTSSTPPDLTLEHTDLMIEYAEAVLFNLNLDADTVKHIVRIISPFVEAFVSGFSHDSDAASSMPRQTPTEEFIPDAPPHPLTAAAAPDESRYAQSPEELENAARFREMIERRMQQIATAAESAAVASPPEEEHSAAADESLAAIDQLLHESSGIAARLLQHLRTVAASPLHAAAHTKLRADPIERAQILTRRIHEALVSRSHGDTAAPRDLEAPLHALISHHDELFEASRALRTFSARTATLALNAALEAARAGEGGKCFGVIAAELQHLARGSEALAQHLRKNFKACRYYAHQSLAVFRDCLHEGHAVPPSLDEALRELTPVLAAIEVSLSAQGAANGASLEMAVDIATKLRAAELLMAKYLD